MDQVENTMPQLNEPPRGIFVSVEKVENGMAVTYELVGGMDPLSAPALLELAAGVARQKIGLAPHG